MPSADRNFPVPVAGFVPFTTVDFPGRIAAVLFLQGCPWRCPYCHNSHLRTIRPGDMPWADILQELRKRRHFLDGVVFSGGEPTCHPGLRDAIGEVRKLGFEIGLHTAGIYPSRLAEVLRLVDWVGLDIKAPLDQRYDRLVGAPGAAERVRRSFDIVVASGVPHQLRTTWDKDLLNEVDIAAINDTLTRRGEAPTVIQDCRQAAEL